MKHFLALFLLCILFLSLTAQASAAECKEDFCKSLYFDYVKRAVMSDKVLKKNVDTYSSKYDLNKKLFYSILITENLRMHTQFPGAYKGTFLKYKVPMLAQMTQYAYGYFGVKSDAINKLVEFNGKKEYTIGKNTKLSSLAGGNEKKQSQIVLKDKALQVELTAILLKQHVNAYENVMSRDLRSNPEILLTLYNLGANGYKKKPHGNPQSGGSYSLYFTKKCFGDAAGEIYSSEILKEMVGK